MKTKLVLWGTNAQEERVLIALQLRANDNKVDLYVFPESIVTDEFHDQLLNTWRNAESDAEMIAFPEGHQHTERELTMTDSILPEDLKVERGDLIQRATTEWHFAVLSTKLNAAYQSELKELEDKVGQLTAYSAETWESLKSFWGKVQEQVKERNLYREHAATLSDTINGLFDKLKGMRSDANSEFETRSKELYDQFVTTLEAIEKKIEDSINQRFPNLFDELKTLQADFRKTRLTREHGNDLWNRIDNAFKNVKEKRFGNNAIVEGTASERLEKRLEGLDSAIAKMEESIRRDQEDFDFQSKQVERSAGQLESQIRQAKLNMVKERLQSKQEKLNEMLATKADVVSKIANQKEKDAKKATTVTEEDVVEK